MKDKLFKAMLLATGQFLGVVFTHALISVYIFQDKTVDQQFIFPIAVIQGVLVGCYYLRGE